MAELHDSGSGFLTSFVQSSCCLGLYFSQAHIQVHLRGFWQGIVGRLLGGHPQFLTHYMGCPHSPVTAPPRVIQKGERARNREHLRWKAQTFYNLILEVTSQRACHILFIRDEAISPSILKGRRSHKGRGPRRWGSLGPP